MGMNHEIGRFETACIKVMMPVLFRSVYGWRNKDAAAEQGERFDIHGVDGSILKAIRFTTARAPAKGIVLLCHPFLKYGMDYFVKNNYHEWLNDAGYDVVAFNFKGFGTSSVSGIAFSDDVQSAAQWIAERQPELPLHLLGVSFGAYHSVHGIARHEMRFASALFDSVPMEISSFFSAGAFGAVMRWLSRSRWGHPTGTKPLDDSLPALSETPCQFLFGRNDKLISSSEISRLRVNCPNAGVVLYDDCGHLELRKTHPRRYISDITNFFDLHGAAQRAPKYLNE